jgi:pyridoxamine 5'-phosphate oxidase
MADDAWARVRREYADVGLREVDAGADPYPLLERWLADALAAFDAGVLAEPNAMALATVGPDGSPSVRTVLLKGMYDGGLCFYTNHDSRKGQDLAAEPRCAATLLWHALQRQVRVEGRAHRLPDEVSDAYFASRPRPAQLGAWASPQSRPVPDRAVLERAYVEVEERFAGRPEVPRPPHWGGWRVVPGRVEFWHGRPGRMHDRLRFTRTEAASGWERERLAP